MLFIRSQLKVSEEQLLGRVGVCRARWVLVPPAEIVAVREFLGRPGYLRVTTAARTFSISIFSSDFDAVVDFLVTNGHGELAAALVHKHNELFYRRQFHARSIAAALANRLKKGFRALVGKG